MPDQDAPTDVAALVRELAETKALLEAAAAELDRRDEHLAHLRGTVPGDQGGEPRRPQAGDSVEHSLLGRPEPIEVTAIDLHAFRAVGTDGSRWTIPYKSPHWRWPATQGAAVAGPAQCSCSHLQVEHRRDGICVNHLRCLCDGWSPRTFTPPPASEPPRSYSPSCAGTCWPPCAHHGVEVALFMYKDRTRVLVQLAEVTAAKAALEAARDNAVRERDEARADRTRALALATEHLEAKAALEAQLRDDRAAHARTTELWRRDEEKGIAAERALRDERDALAAQLAGVVRVLESIEAYSARTLGATTAEKDRALDWICGQAKGARAALAASGPVKEGT